MAGVPNHKRSPRPLDVALGVRVQMRRRELGLSGAAVSHAANIPLPQLLKYEQGENRIGFSRLVEIAGALKCNVRDLVHDLEKPTGALLTTSGAIALPGAMALLEAYGRIGDSQSRHAVLQLAQQLAGRKKGRGG